MKKEELFKALEDIDPDSVKKAWNYNRKKKSYKVKWIAAAACAAFICGTIIAVPAIRKSVQEGSDTEYPLGVAAVIADYPEPVAENLSAQTFMESDAHWNWWNSYGEIISESQELQSGMNGYYTDMMKQLLVSENENTVCSPLNTYIAFAMLAEISDGNTRKQILDMLNVNDVDTLRENVSSLWKSNCVDTPVLKSLPANSLWLNSGVKFKDVTLELLAKQYYASSFSGVPGSAEMDQALRKWTDNNTGGLLTEYTKEMSMDPSTVLEILSTIYYKAMWAEKFQETDTTPETFHGTAGDTTVNMMKKTDIMNVYRTENLTSVSLNLTESGAMHFLLPDKNTDVNELVSDPDIIKAIHNNGDDKKWSYHPVNLSVPKFKVSGKVDLLEAIRSLGVTDALDPDLSDFTPLTTDRDELYLSKAEHAATIEIDEHGVTGAAYTELCVNETSSLIDENEVNIVLDRPFMFMVTGKDGSILFSGVVRNIAGDE